MRINERSSKTAPPLLYIQHRQISYIRSMARAECQGFPSGSHVDYELFSAHFALCSSHINHRFHKSSPEASLYSASVWTVTALQPLRNREVGGVCTHSHVAVVQQSKHIGNATVSVWSQPCPSKRLSCPPIATVTRRRSTSHVVYDPERSTIGNWWSFFFFLSFHLSSFCC